MVSVKTEIIINKPIVEVSTYAADPNNYSEWCDNIVSVQWKTPKPMQLNSKIAYKSQFLGKLHSYTYEVVFIEKNKKMIMKIKDGSFPLSTTFHWNSIDENTTIMTIINLGKPKILSTIISPFMSFIVKYLNRKDLKKIKRILENN